MGWQGTHTHTPSSSLFTHIRSQGHPHSLYSWVISYRNTSGTFQERESWRTERDGGMKPQDKEEVPSEHERRGERCSSSPTVISVEKKGWWKPQRRADVKNGAVIRNTDVEILDGSWNRCICSQGYQFRGWCLLPWILFIMVTILIKLMTGHIHLAHFFMLSAVGSYEQQRL